MKNARRMRLSLVAVLATTVVSLIAGGRTLADDKVANMTYRYILLTHGVFLCARNSDQTKSSWV